MFNKGKEFTTKTKLGGQARHIYTEFEGIAKSRTEWMSGCWRICIKPTKLHNGKTIDEEWFDIQEVEIVEESDNKAKTENPGGNQKDPTF